MSKLEELINEYCPDGVAYRILSDVAAYQKQRIDASMVNENNYVGVDNLLQDKAGKTKAASVPSTGSIIRYEQGDILIGNIRPYLRKIWLADCDGGTNGDVLAVHIKCDGVESKYLFYVLSSDNFFYYDVNNSKGAKMPRGDKKAVMKYRFPIPPLEVQREIVRILDNYSAVVAEMKDRLDAELTARKKQYEYYRDDLLSFEGSNSITDILEKMCPDGVEYKTLGEIANDIYRGAGIKRKEVAEKGIPCVRYGEIYTSYDIWFDECISHTDETKQSNGKYFEYGDILFAITGESVEEIAKSIAYVGHEKCMAGGDIVVLKHDQDPKYMAYALSTIDAQKQKSKGKIKSKVVHSSVPALKTISIPIPPIEVQHEIVWILDSFNNLCSDMGKGIPAEIEARQKQYEYYRDKLLTFKEKKQ